MEPIAVDEFFRKETGIRVDYAPESVIGFVYYPDRSPVTMSLEQAESIGNVCEPEAPEYGASPNAIASRTLEEAERRQAIVRGFRSEIKTDSEADAVIGWLRAQFGDLTLAEVGAFFGVSRERARQIQAAALAKLRKVLEREAREKPGK